MSKNPLMASNAEMKEGIKKEIQWKREDGFTLIEVLVVIAIIAILSGIVLVAINPSRQFKIARDSERQANIMAILNAIGQNTTDHSGIFTCQGIQKTLPSIKTDISSAGGIDIAGCLVPDYLPALPFDPSKQSSGYASSTQYDTGYSVSVDVNGRVSVFADSEMSSGTISVIR